MNYLIWNGRDSRNIEGLVICELPPISKPQMRAIETVVDGVDGSIIEELGYESYDKTVSIGITQKADIDEISQYFNGSGDVIFSNEPNKFYRATLVNRIDYARLVRFKVATVTFRVQPFKYEHEEETINSKSSASGTEIELTDVIVMNLMANGKSIQDGTPSPDAPVEIQSVGVYNESTNKYEVNIVITEGTETRTIKTELDEPLRSLPDGTSDAIYIENDFCRIERRVKSIVLNGNQDWENWARTNVDETSALFYLDLPVKPKSASSCMSSHFVKTSNYPVNSPMGVQIATNQRLFVRAPCISISDFFAWLRRNNTEVLYELEYPEVLETMDRTGTYTMPEGSMVITNNADVNMVVSYVANSINAVNNGNYKSKPIITIKGSGYIEFILNGNKVFSYTFPDGDDTVVIDSDKQDAYLGTVLKNRSMNGEFPIFEVGENIVTWDGDVESIEISSKSRWL